MKVLRLDDKSKRLSLHIITVRDLFLGRYVVLGVVCSKTQLFLGIRTFPQRIILLVFQVSSDQNFYTRHDFQVADGPQDIFETKLEQS